jgi:hypothetical protein
MTNPNDSATGFAWSQEQQGTSGLSKREYFSAMALQGFVAATRYHSDSDIEYFAQIAVQAADAIITELNKVQAADALIREVNKKPNNDTPNN